MNRSKRIVLVAHCLLNSNSKVEGLSQYQGALSEVVSLLMKEGIGIVQLPCPELTMYGIKRWGHVKEQFDTPYFRKHCQNIFKPYLEQVQDYLAADYEVIGLIGIDGSPSCGVNRTCSAQWGGEILSIDKEKIKNLEMVEERGIFIEEIGMILKDVRVELSLTAIDEENPRDLKEKVKELL